MVSSLSGCGVAIFFFFLMVFMSSTGELRRRGMVYRKYRRSFLTSLGAREAPFLSLSLSEGHTHSPIHHVHECSDCFCEKVRWLPRLLLVVLSFPISLLPPSLFVVVMAIQWTPFFPVLMYRNSFGSPCV